MHIYQFTLWNQSMKCLSACFWSAIGCVGLKIEFCLLKVGSVIFGKAEALIYPYLNTQFYRIKGGGGSPPPPPPPPIIIFDQQTICRWKGDLTMSRIHFKHWKNILISRFYEQFSRNGSAVAPERLFKKISNL